MKPPRDNFVFRGERERIVESGLCRVERENARRIACPICNLAVLPESMDRHHELHHDD